MQIDRLFSIVYCLMDKERMTAQALAQKLEVSTRTIYRDIQALCMAGVPLYSVRGKGGGIALVEGYALDKAALSETEKRQILTALQTLSATSMPHGEEALQKLSAVFQMHVDKWIDVDFSDWSDTKKEVFETLKAAILQKNVVSFVYVGVDGMRTRRTAEPLQLWFKERAWYLRAYCRLRGAYRLFKLTRMQQVVRQEEPFTRTLPPGPPAETAPYPGQLRVVLDIDGSQAYRVYDEFAPEQIQTGPDGHFRVTAHYPPGEWVIGYILSFGPFAKVLQPQCVQEEVRLRIAKMHRIYRDA